MPLLSPSPLPPRDRATPLAYATLAVLLGALGCGSNAPELPPGLTGGSVGCAAPDYPSQGYGTETGQVVANLCFEGYRAPDRVEPIEANRETVALSDYYDPTGSKGVALLLINTAAIWCSACVSEHRDLPDRQNELTAQGLVIFGTLFQDAETNPATIEDVERWIANFHTNFPMVVDPELLLGSYNPPQSAPLNMVVDPRNMRILRKYVGDQGTVMWPYIEAELGERSTTR